MTSSLEELGEGLDVSRNPEGVLGHLLEGCGFRQPARREIAFRLFPLNLGQKLVQVTVAVVIPPSVREAIGGGFGIHRANRDGFEQLNNRLHRRLHPGFEGFHGFVELRPKWVLIPLDRVLNLLLVGYILDRKSVV